MYNIVALVSYNGKNYQGVQAYFPEKAISHYLQVAFSKIANEPIKITCAGRTDKGVHAIYQPINFVTKSARADYSWLEGANALLPLDIRINEVKILDDLNFSVRFNATKRYYRYIVYKGYSEFYLNIATSFTKKLDVEKMNLAAKYLLGEKDFTSFRNKHCNSNTPFRFVEFVEVFETENFIAFDILANAFLHNMVRNIMGSLLLVGIGKHEPQWIEELLIERDHAKIGKIAPPDGLYLVGVKYKEELFLHPNKYIKGLLVNKEIIF